MCFSLQNLTIVAFKKLPFNTHRIKKQLYVDFDKILTIEVYCILDLKVGRLATGISFSHF
jgi:hypothetical protein